MNTNFKQSSAYELADLIGLCGDGGYNQDAANMLRQQADRIAELEKEIEECWCGGHSYAYLRAKNRLPQTKTENIWTSCSACGQKVTEDLIHTCSPQTKPLSDLDVMRISEQCDLNHVLGIIDFARAIEERHGIK